MTSVTHFCFKPIIFALKLSAARIDPEGVETHQQVSHDLVKIWTFQQAIQDI